MATRKPASDKIGPGNPPRSTRFQKGQSGNPGGRPKKERDFAKLVDKELDEVVATADGKLTKRQFIAKRLVAGAAKGNLKAIDRVIGLTSKSGGDNHNMIDIHPAVLASFLARYGAGGSGESGAAA